MEGLVTTASVVVGTDGSGHALRAVEWAAREAAARGASLRIVSVPWAWPVSTPPGSYWFAVSQDASDADRAAASAAVAAAADRAAELFPRLPVEADVVPGYPVQILLDCAAEASLLVVGSRGAGGFAAMMLGSVSRCIATNSPCPAVVVKSEPMPVRGEVVVGIREPEHAAAALRFGFEEAALRHSRLLVVHAWGSPGLLEHTLQRRIDQDEVAAIAAERLQKLLDECRSEYPAVELETQIVHDHPGRALSVASGRADLVVLGRHHIPRSDGPAIGSALHTVLDHAPGPVAIIPDC
jgi:nucleotide-binding universal stress UspA family protein